MPRLHTLFRFSTYLTLTLATICIGLTQRGQIQGAVGFYMVVGLAILVAYLLEDRWIIPRSIANVLALFILVGWIVWARFSLAGTVYTDDVGADLLRLLLPRAGPLLSVLMLVKLFRPKLPFDYWSLHALGLVQVVLGCVLALGTRLDRENLFFATLISLYLISGIWSLVIFYLHRENVAALPPRGRTSTRISRLDPATAQLRALSPWRSLGVVSSLAWFAVAFVLGLMLFFLVPRPGHDAAATLIMPSAAQAVTGFNPGVDLNNVGTLQVNEELVMRVEARDSNDRAINLGSEQRFRGVTCGEYIEGKWRPRRFMDHRPLQVPFGAEAGIVNPLTLTYHIDMTKLRGSGLAPGDFLEGQVTAVFLAEPVYAPEGQPPIRVESRLDQRPGVSFRDIEAALLAPNLRRSRALRYSQTFVGPGPTDTKWVQRIPKRHSFTLRQYDKDLGHLPQRLQDSGLISRETRRVLAQLNVPDNASIERKARALESYLATSGQFAYSLDWQRKDRKLDPTEDFLVNVKQGHCELFASALALMLRSQGIRARVVIGFRGSEWNNLTEQNEVRQYHAHAWVEAQIDMRDQSLTATLEDWHWLTLDPTPAGGTAGAVGADGLRGDWDDELHFLQFLWESFILDYSGDTERERLMARLGKFEWLKSSIQFWSNLASFNKYLTTAVILGLVLLVAGVVLRYRRRSVALTGARIRVAFYARLLKALARIALRPRPSQTAAEFAAEAAAVLAKMPGLDQLAALPPRVVDFFYAVRFGGETLDPTVLQTLDSELSRLAAAVKA